MESDLSNFFAALGLLASIVAVTQQPPPVLTWQDIVLLATAGTVAAAVIIVVVVTARRIINEQKVLLKFLENLKSEVGTDSGSTLAARLHAQDERSEVARLLAERIAAEGRAQDATDAEERADLRKMILSLSALFEKMQVENAFQQKFNEQAAELQAVRAEAIAKGLTLSIFNAANDARLSNTHQSGGVAIAGGETKVAGDLAGRDTIKAGDTVTIDKAPESDT